MTTPTRIGVRHAFPGCLIYEFIVTAGWRHIFVMHEEDYGRATYYPPGGSCIVDTAANTAIIGTVCSGFMDLDLYPQLNTMNSGYTQVVQNDMSWYCVHYTDDTYDSISLLELDGTSTVAPNTAVVVFDGEINGVSRVNLIPATETGFDVSGTGKAFLLVNRQ